MSTVDRQPLLPNPQPKQTPSTPAQPSKSREIQPKFRTYEIILALHNGYFPTTRQFVGHLNWLLRSGILEPRNRQLSVRGRNAIRDLRSWIEAVRDEAENKNGHDEIQEFLWELRQADVDVDIPSMPVSSRTVKEDSRKALKQLRTLGELLYCNSEFRKILSDANILFRDIFAEAVTKAAEQVADSVHAAVEQADGARPSQAEVNDIDKPADEGQQKDNKPPSADDIKDKVGKAVQEAKQNADETKRSAMKKGKKARDDVQEFLNRKFPKQRQDAVINRLKKMITDIQKDPDYMDAINFLLDLLTKYARKAKELAQNAQQEVQAAEPNNHLEMAISHAHTIVINFAGGQDLQGIQSGLEQLFNEIWEDKEVEKFFSDVNRFIQRALKEEGFVMTDAADNEAHSLYERGRQLTTENDKYKECVEEVGDEFGALFESIRNDRGNRRVILSGKKVFEDFTVEDGSLDVWKDFVDVVLPKAISLVRYVPVPRIEYQDVDIDLAIDNLVFESDNFLPSKIRLDSHSQAKFTSAYSFESEYSNTTTIKIDEFRIRARDISYAFRKKTGFFQFEDKGLISVYLDKKGVSTEIKLTANASTSPNEDSFFQVDKVRVDIHNFTYSLRQSEHKMVATLFYPFVKAIIRHQLEAVLEREIKSQFEQLDSWFHDLKARLRVAKGLGPEAWVQALLQSGPQSSGRAGGHYMVNIGGKEGLRGFRGPIGEAMVQAEMGPEEGRGWKNKIFDPPQN